MAESVSELFITQYVADVKIAYQQMAAKLRKAVYLKTGVKGSKARFQKVGKGEARQKTRHGDIPTMGVSHGKVEGIMETWYAADYSDAVDEAMHNIDERKILAKTGAGAISRKGDDIVFMQLAMTPNVIDLPTTGLVKSKIQIGLELLFKNDVPEDDNEIYAAVGPHQWNELMELKEFANSDYVGADGLPWKGGARYKQWNNVNWMQHNRAPLSGSVRDVFIWHKMAVGYAENIADTCRIDFIPEKDSHFVNNKFTACGAMIDSDGIVCLKCKEDSVISE